MAGFVASRRHHSELGCLQRQALTHKVPAPKKTTELKNAGLLMCSRRTALALYNR